MQIMYPRTTYTVWSVNEFGTIEVDVLPFLIIQWIYSIITIMIKVYLIIIWKMMTICWMIKQIKSIDQQLNIDEIWKNSPILILNNFTTLILLKLQIFIFQWGHLRINLWFQYFFTIPDVWLICKLFSPLFVERILTLKINQMPLKLMHH